MKKKCLLLTGLLLLICGLAKSQELKVSSFQLLERDLLARTQERLDLNDVPCAVVRVSVPGTKDYTFEGNIVGDVIYRPGEAIIYMADGTRNITIKSDKFGTLKYDFDTKLKKQVVYKLELKLIQSEANKVRTLVMPVMGIGTTTSYGAMIGVVKKAGGYAKVKANFKNQATDYECTDQGTNPDGTPMWFTDKTNVSRLAVTGGMLFRVALPFYLYAGAGYGYSKVAWQLAPEHDEATTEQWAENTDKSSSGVEAELGCILRLKNFALSAGVQSNSFKYFEATVGIGIMF